MIQPAQYLIRSMWCTRSLRALWRAAWFTTHHSGSKTWNAGWKTASARCMLCHAPDLAAGAAEFGKSVKTPSSQPEICWDGSPEYVLFHANQKSVKLSAHWLRYNCSCETCRQISSGQRLIDPLVIPPRLTLKSVDNTPNPQRLLIRWKEEEHDGVVSIARIRDVLDYIEIEPEPHRKNSKLPRFAYSALISDSQTKDDFYTTILGGGFALVDGLPVEKGTVKQFVGDVFGLPVQRTIYGEVFDVLSTPNPVNVAYSNAELKPHIDLAYYESPPGLQLLHCLQFDETVKGGDSTVVDAFEVAEELRRQSPDAFRALSTIPATFEKIHFNREWPVHMRYRRPHIAVNGDGQVTAVFWAPQFEGPLVPPANSDIYYPAYRKFAELISNSPNRIQLRLQPGEMLVFNNRRMLHGRTAFTVSEGIRHFQGAYVNIDEFKSQAQVARIKRKFSPNVPRVANQSC